MTDRKPFKLDPKLLREMEMQQQEMQRVAQEPGVAPDSEEQLFYRFESLSGGIGHAITAAIAEHNEFEASIPPPSPPFPPASRDEILAALAYALVVHSLSLDEGEVDYLHALLRHCLDDDAQTFPPAEDEAATVRRAAAALAAIRRS